LTTLFPAPPIPATFITTTLSGPLSSENDIF
jgi:hypothetical protein